MAHVEKLQDDVQVFLNWNKASDPWRSPFKGRRELNVIIIKVENQEKKLESSKGEKQGKKLKNLKNSTKPIPNTWNRL